MLNGQNHPWYWWISNIAPPVHDTCWVSRSAVIRWSISFEPQELTGWWREYSAPNPFRYNDILDHYEDVARSGSSLASAHLWGNIILDLATWFQRLKRASNRSFEDGNQKERSIQAPNQRVDVTLNQLSSWVQNIQLVIIKRFKDRSDLISREPSSYDKQSVTALCWATGCSSFDCLPFSRYVDFFSVPHADRFWVSKFQSVDRLSGHIKCNSWLWMLETPMTALRWNYPRAFKLLTASYECLAWLRLDWNEWIRCCSPEQFDCLACGLLGFVKNTWKLDPKEVGLDQSKILISAGLARCCSWLLSWFRGCKHGQRLCIQGLHKSRAVHRHNWSLGTVEKQLSRPLWGFTSINHLKPMRQKQESKSPVWRALPRTEARQQAQPCHKTPADKNITQTLLQSRSWLPLARSCFCWWCKCPRIIGTLLTLLLKSVPKQEIQLSKTTNPQAQTCTY